MSTQAEPAVSRPSWQSTSHAGQAETPARILPPRNSAGIGGWLAAAVFGLALYSAQQGGLAASAQSQALRFIDEAAVAAGLAIGEIRVVGNSSLPAEAVIAALALPPAVSLAGVDTAAAARRLEAVGWVAKARVHRIWPRALGVTVTEREPFAIWQDSSGTWQAVDRAGIRLDRVAAGDYRALPRIAGEGAPEAAAGLITALAAFPALATRLDLATRAAGRTWRLRAGEAPELLLADATLDTALAEAQHLGVLDPGLQRAVARIDLRVPSATLLRLRDATPAAAAAFVAGHAPETTAALGKQP